MDWLSHNFFSFPLLCSVHVPPRLVKMETGKIGKWLHPLESRGLALPCPWEYPTISPLLCFSNTGAGWWISRYPSLEEKNENKGLLFFKVLLKFMTVSLWAHFSSNKKAQVTLFYPAGRRLGKKKIGCPLASHLGPLTNMLQYNWWNLPLKCQFCHYLIIVYRIFRQCQLRHGCLLANFINWKC